MDLQLKGKRALVTGSSGGIGEAIARALAAEGVGVVIHGRDRARAEAVVAAIRGDGGAADIALGSLSDEEGANAVAEAALAGGPVDILVNNAGAYDNLSWWTATPDKWLETIQSDALSSVRMIQRLVPAMRDGGWGRVIQVGSGTASQPFAGYPQYCATKAMTHNLAVSLARELKGSGVTSNVVSPGLIKVKSVETWFTAMAPEKGWGDGWDAIEAGVVRDILPNDIGRLGTPEEVAAAVAFLASPLAAYVSGANWRVDGGAMLNVN